MGRSGTRAFRIVAWALLAWALLGDAAFLLQATADLDALARTDAMTAAAFRSMPWWAWTAYGVAVGAGTLGAVLLFMRRKAAVPVFALSLAGVVVQFGWSFLGFGMIAAKGWSSAIFPAVIFAIALAALLHARAKVADGTLR